jgi:hypothetical protein
MTMGSHQRSQIIAGSRRGPKLGLALPHRPPISYVARVVVWKPLLFGSAIRSTTLNTPLRYVSCAPAASFRHAKMERQRDIQ